MVSMTFILKFCFRAQVLMVLLLCSTSALAQKSSAKQTVIKEETGINALHLPAASTRPFIQTLSPYKPIYVTHSWFLNGEGSDEGYLDQELLLHFSFKRVIYGNLFFAYTHKAFWQIYDHGNSRPFREHNYNPELFLEWEQLWRIDDLRLGLMEHESNGEKLRYEADAAPVNRSRTWNRTYLYAQKSVFPSLKLGLKLWTVTDSDDPDEASFIVDNSDIQQYLGSGEVYIEFGRDPSFLSIMLRRGWQEETETIRAAGRIPLNLLFRCEDKGIDLFAQVFVGYGDSLIDYNRRVTRFSAGVSFR